jgi:hypothetical protein
MTRLFELAQEYRALSELESSDDLPPEVIADTLEGLQGEFQDKAAAVAKFILSLEADAAAIKAVAEAQANRAARLQKRAESIRQYLLLQFLFAGFDKKIETPEIRIARRKNPEAVNVIDESLVPAEYWRQPPPPPKQLDKVAIKAAIDGGVKVEGCYLAAGERIDIRI